MKTTNITKLVKQITIGKHVSSDVYVHVSALSKIPKQLQELVIQSLHPVALDESGFNVFKFSKTVPRLSILCYPNFFNEAFPVLEKSLTINLNTGQKKIITFKYNPPILHRKETLLSADHPDIQMFIDLTKAAEHIGLFKHPTIIGRLNTWNNLLADNGYCIKDHCLIKLCDVN